jgi:subtilase-type serine protease
LIAASAMPAARAGVIAWTPGVTGAWDDNTLWLGGIVPVGTDTATISNGTVTVNGLDAADTLYLGTAGDGSLTFGASGILNTNTAVLANNAGDTGTVTLTAGHIWNNLNDLYVGNGGTGEVTLSGAGLMTGSTSHIYLGAAPSGSGTLEITAGSTLFAGLLDVGFSGSGTLAISGLNSTAITKATVLGTAAGASGSATVSDNAHWTITSTLTVGSSGTGQLQVDSGGVLNTTGTATIGLTDGSLGNSVTVDGTGSLWQSPGMLYVGALGEGQLTVSNGGVVNSTSDTVVARGGHSNSAITVTGTGSTFITHMLTLGGDITDTANAGGQGLLRVAQGGEVHTGQVLLGDVAGGGGTIDVQDAGSVLLSSDRLSVGRAGTGHVSVTNGGRIESQGALVGHEAGSSGTVTLSGVGSIWVNHGVFYVGNLGQGVLQVNQGATLISTDGYVATEAGSDSQATISGADSVWTNSGDFFVGHNNGARGTMTVSDGGLLQSNQGILGDLAGAQGSMTITGAGSHWQNAGDLNVGRLGSGVMTVAQGGLVSAPTIYIANNAGSQGVLNIGAAAGSAPDAAGVLQTDALRFGDGDGRLVFNFTDPRYTFSAPISGTGAIDLLAGNLVLTGASTFTGLTTVSGGNLTVDGSIGGSLVMGSGTTLAGTGSVGTTTVNSGAVLAPGSGATPIGTLTVNGNLTFAPGSAYQVQTDSASAAADKIHVTGTANLAGSVVHLGTGLYAASTSYTILTADQGLHGTFDSIASNLAFLAPTLAYDSNNVNLLIDMKQAPGGGTGPDQQQPGGGTNPIRFADAAVTGNQRAVANALQSLPVNNALYGRVLNLAEGAPPAVFNSLSGEVHASTAATLQGVAGNVISLPMAHLRENLGAGQLTGPATAQAGPSDAGSLPRSAAQPVWAQVFGNWRTLNGNGNSSKTHESDGGLFIGGDRGVGAGWRLGGALGYTGSHSSVHDLTSKSDVDSYSATIYGGKAFEAGAGKINLTLGAAYTWHDITTKRDANAAGQSQSLDASYNASTGQVFTELGYALPLNDRVTIEPFAGADYSDLRTRGFSESGGDAALNGASGRNDVTTTTFGLHAQTTFDSSGSQGRLHGTVGWRHAFGDVNPTTTMAFNGSQSFTVAGAPIARDAAVLELGVDMAVTKHTTVGVAYTGQFGSGNQQNSGSIDVRWRF